MIGVTSSGDAMKVLGEAPVCATIADHMLHRTTGTELAKRMKKLKPDVPIILFSGNTPERLVGVDVFINKGEPTAEFLSVFAKLSSATVRRWVDIFLHVLVVQVYLA